MNFTGIFSALIAAFFFGLIPTITKVAYSFEANPSLAIILRYSLASIIIILPLLLTRIDKHLIINNILLLLVISLGSIFLTSGLLISVIFIPVSLVALIFYTYPLIVITYAFYRGKKMTTIQIVGFCSAFLGLGIAIGPSFEILNLYGILLAFLAAIGAATVLIANEYLAKDLSAITINAFVNFTCLIVFGVIILFNKNIEFPQSSVGWYFIILASLCYCIAFYVQLIAVKNIGSSKTSLLLYLEPVIAIISAIILLNENLTKIQIIGTIMVIFSLIITTRKLRNSN